MANNFTETAVIALFTALMMSGLVLVVSGIGEMIEDKQFFSASKQSVYILSGAIFILLSLGTFLIRKEEDVGIYVTILLVIAAFFMGIVFYLM